jgi:hypothetical protein
MILRNVRGPVELEVEEVPESEFDRNQMDFFGPWDDRLEAMGYRPALNYRVTNLPGANLVRGYFSVTEWPAISLNLLRSRVRGGADQTACYLEIVSQFADGTLLSTRKAELDEVFDPVPTHIIEDFRGERDPANLKARHDRRAKELESRGRLHLPPGDLFDRLLDHHGRRTAHQIGQGLLQRDAADGLLRPTLRTTLRGIRNFVNPLADNFNWPRFAIALFFGLVVPCLGLRVLAGPLAPLVDRLSHGTGLSVGLLDSLALGMLLTLTGATVGGLFTAKSFIWTFALAYVPLRLLGPSGLAPLWLSLWTGFVADRVDRLHERGRVPV